MSYATNVPADEDIVRDERRYALASPRTHPPAERMVGRRHCRERAKPTRVARAVTLDLTGFVDQPVSMFHDGPPLLECRRLVAEVWAAKSAAAITAQADRPHPLLSCVTFSVHGSPGSRRSRP
jgi:hypothetical protein